MAIQIKHQNQPLNSPIRRSNPEVTLQTTNPRWTHYPITFTQSSKKSLSKLITFKNSIGEN
ncbi:hypothetical protein CGK39_07765 [Vibrio parahaemolyticus]|nr:hypothetical protein [Vibrio parahaemolyticus]TNZ85077.1 hypothetical protein CGK39_07765 [Vibrio parahaemolyticus]